MDYSSSAMEYKTNTGGISNSERNEVTSNEIGEHEVIIPVVTVSERSVINCSKKFRITNGNHFLNAPEEKTHAPDDLTHVPEDLTHAPDNLTHAPEDLTHAPDDLTLAPDKQTYVISERRGRKGRGQTTKKEERKKCRARGEQYITAQGKVRSARRVRSPCKNCQWKCTDKVGYEERCRLLEKFYQNDPALQRIHIAGQINSVDKNRTRKRNKLDKESRRQNTYQYFLNVNGQNVQVCKRFFIGTYDISNKYVEIITAKKQQSSGGFIPVSRAGKHSPKHAAKEEDFQRVANHINSLPTHGCHYCRRGTEKQYLPAHLNLKIIHKKYTEICQQNCWKVMSLSFYRNIFFTKFNLSFKKPDNDRCAKCSLVAAQVKFSTQTEKNQVLEYQQEKEDGLAEKQKDKEKIESEPCLQVCTSQELEDSDVYYKKLLLTYNVTI